MILEGLLLWRRKWMCAVFKANWLFRKGKLLCWVCYLTSTCLGIAHDYVSSLPGLLRLSCGLAQVAPSIIQDISYWFYGICFSAKCCQFTGGSLKRLWLCVRKSCGDSRLRSKIPERVNLAEFRVGLRVEKKSKYCRKLQISSFYEDLQKHSNTLVISSD